MDNVGAFATTPAAAISVNPPGVPPTISLTAPSDGASYIAPATVVFQVTAADSDGSVAFVECLAEGTVVATDTSTPYACTWSGVGAGTYTLTARATDNTGLVTSSAALSVTVRANTPPLITVTSPPNGGSYYYPFVLTFAANAWDAEGNLSVVDFYVNNGHVGSDTSAPYAVEWGAPSSGTFAFMAVARDGLGASRSASVTITILPPTGRYKYKAYGQCYWEANDSGPDFQVNGIPKFLYFVSFNDGLREARLSPPQLDTDLTYIQVLKADGIRVFPNWWLYKPHDVENPDNLGAGTDTLFNHVRRSRPVRRWAAASRAAFLDFHPTRPYAFVRWPKNCCWRTIASPSSA